MESSDYKVVVNRVTAVEVLRIASVYESIVGDNVHKFGPVTGVLDRAIGKYFHDTHSTDIADFGKWLDASTGADTNAARALEILQRLKRIYIEEQKIGLTPKEIEISQTTITAKFAPHGLAAADFKKIIDSVNPAPLNERPL